MLREPMRLHESVRTYKDEASLLRSLEKFGFADDRYIIVWTEEGRCTAIFGMSNFKNGGYVGLYSSKGFTTFG